MTRPSTGFPQWAMVDEGWGRKAVDFATLSEPGQCREYVAAHHRPGVDAGDWLLDVACGSGLAIEPARLRGAFCSGVDASARLVAVARDPNPECDIRTGDMYALPWDPASFDVVTSYRGGQPSSACKFVLVGLANHAGPDGTGAAAPARGAPHAASGGSAEEYFAALGGRWQLTGRQRARLIPAAMAALDAG